MLSPRTLSLLFNPVTYLMGMSSFHHHHGISCPTPTSPFLRFVRSRSSPAPRPSSCLYPSIPFRPFIPLLSPPLPPLPSAVCFRWRLARRSKAVSQPAHLTHIGAAGDGIDRLYRFPSVPPARPPSPCPPDRRPRSGPWLNRAGFRPAQRLWKESCLPLVGSFHRCRN